MRRADQAPGGALDREFVTLDNVRRTLEPADLLIADPEKPLAIAGIMGGLNSEVSAATTDLVLESAYFEPMTIARTARRLGLRSEASYRFERAIDRGGSDTRARARRRADSQKRRRQGLGDRRLTPSRGRRPSAR